MIMRQHARQVASTLILAAALTFTGGCIRSPKGETLMADKPKTPIVLRDAQEEVKSPKRALDAVPVLQNKEKIKGEEFKHHDMGFKDRKRTTPHFELK